jgi:hypothetical protein
VTCPPEVPTCAVARCDRYPSAGVVCSPHRRRLEELLDDGLAELYVELNQVMRRPTRGGTDVVVSMSKDRRLPIGAEARACQEKTLVVATAMEDALRVAEGWIARPARGREGPTLQGSCRVLSAHLDTVLALEGGPAFADRLVRLGHRCEAALGRRGTPSSTVEAPCPECGTFSLLRRNGTDDVACVACEKPVAPEIVDEWLAA